MRHLLFVMLLAGLSGVATAEVADVYDFRTVEQEQRFQNLIEELRCPKCQNQNIADSNAPISKDMRAEVYRMMSEGATDREIIDALVARFGEFILYKPEVEKRTILLWATPAIAVLGGLLMVTIVVIRSRRGNAEQTALTPEEKARVEKILAEGDRDTKA
ncbi:cytochrome c-type biogenesis protein CcmH [Marinobacter sp. M216]|uniref:Cytochrome c-type biogenesis protein n=1 Tax=Marinobacter albus TaxID=3030833 RepID=A0ABT7HC06_9GAMM|nr:cytochrome c-type biogenesis protein [Marinobacter sp. M216]MDK9557405.1 cytochrome c-type biogenesis protein CcmH [Marinobacter sp. M216]